MAPTAKTTARPHPPSFATTAGDDPWSYYEDLRRDGVDIFWDDEFEAWMIASYALTRDVLKRDERSFRRADAEVVASDATYLALKGEREITILEGDEHQRMHRWWLRAVSQQQVARWLPLRIRPVIDAVIERFIADGRADLDADFAKLIPVRVMASVMGLPWQDDEWIGNAREWMDTKAQFLESFWSDPDGEALKPVRQRATRVVAEFRELLRPFAEAARHSAGDDLTAMFWRDGPDILPEWGIEDVITGMTTAFFAGSDTTSHGMTNAMWMLLTRPELQEQLRGADDETLGHFVEEVLRIAGVAHFVSALKANEDFQVGEVLVRKDESVHALLACANLDPRQYQCPHAVDLTRRSPRDHVAFYMGPRSCGGMWLARSELREAVKAILERFDDLRLDPQAPAPELTGMMVRSYRPLHARFSAPAAA
jgi:cytochrome P450